MLTPLVDQPDDYISVFSLRNWAKMRSGTLTTEIVSADVLVISKYLTVLQVYIHAKVYAHQSNRISYVLKSFDLIRSVSWMIV